MLKFRGFFVLKNVFCKNNIDKYGKAYFSNVGLNRTPFHLTEVRFDDQHDLSKIILESGFIKIASHFFAGNVGCYSMRIVKKDAVDVKPVFLHHDVSYHMGGFERYSIFIPLTKCSFDNGGLICYPCTHHFGYLGDAGEISDNILPDGYPKIISNMEPGDALIMHSAVWHESPENKNLTDRVYFDIYIQNANETTTKSVICGERTSEWSNSLAIDEIFVNSRTQRLKNLYQQVDELTAK